MTMRTFYVILVSAVCTLTLRALPFVLFRKDKAMPAWLSRLGEALLSQGYSRAAHQGRCAAAAGRGYRCAYLSLEAQHAAEHCAGNGRVYAVDSFATLSNTKEMH